MKLTEKMSYVQGLIEGLSIDDSTKEGKALLAMTDVMHEMVSYIEDLQSQVDELTELCDILDEDLGSIEDDLYADYDDEDDDMPDCGSCDYDDNEYEDEYEDDDDGYEFDEDDELYEVTCPKCGDTILINEDMLDEGTLTCPNCDELLEFDCNNLTFEDFESGADETLGE